MGDEYKIAQKFQFRGVSGHGSPAKAEENASAVY
jgi:hypothetical protein